MKKTSFLKATVILFTLITSLSVMGCAKLFPHDDQQDQLIQGTWVIKGEPENKWVITATEVHWVIEGNILYRFNYSISTETAPSGLIRKYLNLIEVGDPNSTSSYVIDGLDSKTMTLETIDPKISYTHFIKQ